MNSERKTRDATEREVEWVEVPMMGGEAGGERRGYEICWGDGTRLIVPRGFCAEELTVLVELPRQGRGAMITLSPATKVYLAAGATDLRRSFDGLFGLAQGKLGRDPLSGHLFVFCNRARTRIKVLYFDGSGLWLCAKRLEEGRFSWPEQSSEAGSACCGLPELWLVLSGIDPKDTRRKRWWGGPARQAAEEKAVS